MKKIITIWMLVCFVSIFVSCQMESVKVEEQGTEQTETTTNVPASEEEKVTVLNPDENTLETRVNTPKGYERVEYEGETARFAEFLREFPLKKSGSKVLLFDGRKKGNQKAHIAVTELPIEEEDLQQCADSVMRMYAEYFWSTEQYDKIMFHLSDGFELSYSKWREGYRVGFENEKPYWYQKTGFDDSYETFVKYMRIVFAYAGTASMASLEAEDITMAELKVGDVFLKGGSPGHVVMVVDVCENEEGQKAFLLAQGYMPAQEFHILKNPLHENDPWYYGTEVTYPLRTPEYSFAEDSLKRLSYLNDSE